MIHCQDLDKTCQLNIFTLYSFGAFTQKYNINGTTVSTQQEQLFETKYNSLIQSYFYRIN